ncbi:MAG: VWA domain-containing protein [Verrucomicrobiae bacterium]|nr:VWA domain-containing protein [Verrucomicrobiae bacterium]
MSAEMRRLPVYLVLDCSGSMTGEPIEAVRQGMRLLVDDLQCDPQALENAWLSVITFSKTAKQVAPLTEISQFQIPNIDIESTTSLGDALRVLSECMTKEVRKHTAQQKGDFRPLVFLMTDGMPTDDWKTQADAFKKKWYREKLNEESMEKEANVIACAAGPQADDRILKEITSTVVRLQDASQGSLKAFFKWVTASIVQTSASVTHSPDAAVNLPALPVDQGIVIVP